MPQPRARPPPGPGRRRGALRRPFELRPSGGDARWWGAVRRGARTSTEGRLRSASVLLVRLSRFRPRRSRLPRPLWTHSRAAAADRALPRRRLRLQDRAAELRRGAGGAAGDERARPAGRPRARRRCRRLSARRRPGARPDRRLLHPDRRRPAATSAGSRPTNALSDVYAMGGRRSLALNLVAFALGELGAEVLAEILPAAAETPPRPAPRSPAATRSTTPSPSTGWRSAASSTPTGC